MPTDRRRERLAGLAVVLLAAAAAVALLRRSDRERRPHLVALRRQLVGPV
jgi:hypothetical protein